jgi:hypothetical protein
LKGATTPEEMRQKAKNDSEFCDKLLKFIDHVTSECMPPEVVDEEYPKPGYQLFQPFIDPNDPSFDEHKAILLYDTIRYCQMHSVHHNPTCFKYGKRCQAHFPRKKYDKTTFDPDTGVFCIKRDDAWLNGFNELITIALRANHDCQFLFTKDYTLAVVHYVIKYISKTEQ